MRKDVKIFRVTLSAMIISAFLFSPLAVNGQAGKTNFAGTWTLNAEKSNFGQGQPGQGQRGLEQPALLQNVLPGGKELAFRARGFRGAGQLVGQALLGEGRFFFEQKLL